MDCKNCKFYHGGELGKDLERVGHCYRYPPTISVVPTQNGQAANVVTRPPVRDDDYCGEFVQSNSTKLIN